MATVSETRITSGVTKTTSPVYNLDGSIKSITYPSTHTVNYTYSAAGRALSAIDPAGPINYATSATYAPPGELVTATNGFVQGGFTGINTANVYSNRLQPVLLSAASPTATILSLCYDFHSHTALNLPPCNFSASTAGDNGNVYQIVNNRDSNRTQNFVYDNLNRILQGYTSGTNWGEDFTIDAWANLTNRSLHAGKTNSEPLNAAPALTSNQLTGFGYDAAGNMTSNGTLGYNYDQENRLTKFITNITDIYIYDGDGERVKKSVPAVTLYWYGATGNVLDETSGTGTLVSEYIFFNGKRIARRDADNTVKYYFADSLGSASVITNATGAMPPLEESDYYPYGGEIPITNGDPNHYKFTGKERDAESGLDYFGARHYASSMARWMSPDPINLTSARLVNPTNTLNKYVYGGNNPLKYIDRDGQDITIFYRPPSGASTDFGHILVGALNQSTGQTGFLDYYPKGSTDSLSRGAGAFNLGNMQDRGAEAAAGVYATLTIRTTPEEAKKVIDQISHMINGSAPGYSALSNNCTTVCEDVLHDLGLDFGDVLPASFWANAYKKFSSDAQAHPIATWFYGAPLPQTGHEYGNPRNFGMNYTQLLFQLYMNQQNQQKQPKACVEAHDSSGQGTGTTCN